MTRAFPILEERPPAFSYLEVRKGLLRRSAGAVLCCEQVPLSRLAEQFGTPLYVYSATAIRARLRAFEHAFRKVPHTICYSVKANSNLGILRLLEREGCGFDVVSGGELQRVLAVNRNAAKRVVFSGVGKTGEEMTAALKADILLFNVESESELWALTECAGRLRKAARIAMRVNPDIPANTHPYISTGLHAHKFGVPISEARKLYAKASGTRHLRVRGVSVHIGSQITEVEPFTAALERVADLVQELRADGHKIQYIDAGGGLGIAYETAVSNKAPSRGRPEVSELIAAYASAVLDPLRKLKVHLLLEPGRSIVGPAGSLITRVIYRKRNNSKNFVVVDAAMNDLLRPSLYQAYHEVVPVVVRADPMEPEKVDIVGPICETGDFLARDRELAAVQEGDLLAVLDTGAYGMALASNYNSRPRAAEVLVEGKTAKVIRKREAMADLLRMEG